MNRKNRWLLFGITVLLLSLIGMSGPRIAGGGGDSNATPLNDLGSLSWGVERIEAPQAWERTTGSQEIVVAVIDSGIDTTVPQLAGKTWTNPNEIPGNGIDDDRNGYIDDINGWDFRDEDASSLIGSKIHWHGTFVAGIIASVAPGIRIMDLRFLDSRNLFYGSDWKTFAKAINYAVDNGADIINLSVYANGTPPLILKQAMQRARQHSVIVVGIAGNDGKPQVCYPAKYSSVLAVTATDREDHLASFSNYGSEVTVTAPGEKITSLFPGGIAGTSSGTSFAAPHVSGTLALILSSHPGITPNRAIALLERTSVDLGSSGNDRQFGAGLIDAGKAVTSAS
jgi:subtilisin family serine protease